MTLPLLRHRIGIIGDVHAEDNTLAVVLDYLKHLDNLDAIFCTGDINDGDGDTDRCCALLQATPGLTTVRGNHDRWFFEMAQYRSAEFPESSLTLETRTFLRNLPITRTFDTPLGLLLLCHGLGFNDMEGVYPDDNEYALQHNHALHALVGEGTYSLVVNGHTHLRMVRTIEGVTIINAGTIRPHKQTPGFLIADFDVGTVQAYTVNSEGIVTPERFWKLPLGFDAAV